MTEASPRRLVFIAAILISITEPVLAKEKIVAYVPNYYGAFIRDLSAAMKPKGQLLTAALSQGYGGKNVPDSVFEQVGETIWYNGVPTIEAKTNYAIERKLAGIMIWSLDNDVKGEHSLLNAIVRVYRSRNTEDPPAPKEDRVGFPKDYSKTFEVLRTIERPEKQQIVTVFGNERAASVRRSEDLPYPYGSVIVMETAGAIKDEQGKPRVDDKGRLRKGGVVGLHVMRREQGFGVAYGENRTGEWEYVEYRADGTYLTPPNKSSACAECHVKAGRDRDFVYRGRLPERATK